MKKAKPIIWGIVIAALGVIFGGNALGLFNFNVFFDGWWTLFIIVPSAVALITEKEKLANLGFLAAGVILLLAAQDVFSWDTAWKVILAMFLVVAGITIIVKSVVKGANDKEVEKKVREAGDDKLMDSVIAVFSGSERKYDGEVFGGANLVAVFGGVDLDLRKAKFTKDTVIKAFCMFGGVDIKVPDDVQIKTKSGFIFGGIGDDRKKAKAVKAAGTEKGKYTIYIDAVGGFGGVGINDAED